jgi:hypothetical protein
MTEVGVMHGYLSATRKGYAEQRRRHHAGERPSQHGLTALAEDMRKLTGSVVSGGSTDGPMVH